MGQIQLPWCSLCVSLLADCAGAWLDLIPGLPQFCLTKTSPGKFYIPTMWRFAVAGNCFYKKDLGDFQRSTYFELLVAQCQLISPSRLLGKQCQGTHSVSSCRLLCRMDSALACPCFVCVDKTYYTDLQLLHADNDCVCPEVVQLLDTGLGCRKWQLEELRGQGLPLLFQTQQ